MPNIKQIMCSLFNANDMEANDTDTTDIWPRRDLIQTSPDRHTYPPSAEHHNIHNTLALNLQLKTNYPEPANNGRCQGLAQLAKRVEALGRKRLTVTAKEDQGCCTSAPAKGHCVMYTADGRRFEVPLLYLGTTVIGELLRMSREEFGFASHGEITLPCDATVMEYVMCLLRRNASAEVEKAVPSSMVTPCHYTGCVMMPTVGASKQICCL
ncbi:auxin-responsive protein SAUR36-like [Triticum aestivum]|uniref:auxin-responsive protein SAUR36-like n=1 Tax=Triticum aestivum TaxID=4565 RepID=UPI00098A3029|nr:auxin-responsive protein SAUR36-like [Aegilops tauschii subsp. strangulata]XP_044396759.1 auxin-responsive protein SAUR36-like [Triticum aestivum]